MWSRSACRLPIRWPMAPPFSARASSLCATASLALDIRTVKIAADEAHGADSADELFEPAAELGNAGAAAHRRGSRRRRLHRPRPAVRGERSAEDALDGEGLALVQMVTPVTPPERLAMLCGEAKGFVYAVTMTGTTGGSKGSTVPPEVLDYMRRVKSCSRVPVCAVSESARANKWRNSRATWMASWSAPRWLKYWSAARTSAHS